MIRKVALSLVSVIAVAVAAAATAAEPEAVVVRNRLYSDDGRFEVKLITDLSINNSLTSVDNFQLNLSYHFHEAWAIARKTRLGSGCLRSGSKGATLAGAAAEWEPLGERSGVSEPS